jgi:hypothetical protein
MATSIKSMIPMLDRDINAPGVELYPTASAGSKMGYIADGFWDARLAGTLTTYTIIDGDDLATPDLASDYITDLATMGEDLPEEFQMMVVVFAGARMIRNKILNLAINFKAEAGPVSYEQQASATTLRAVLATLEKRLVELKTMYSDSFTPGAFAYMDGTLQRAAAEVQGYQLLQIA